jgi:hypothetical protein
MFAAVYSVLRGNVVIEMTGVLGIMKVRMLVYNKLKVHIVPSNVTNFIKDVDIEYFEESWSLSQNINRSSFRLFKLAPEGPVPSAFVI